MSALPLVVTNAGRAALVNAANNGTAPVIVASVGVSPTALTAQPTATTLPNEVKRITTIAGDVVADDTIHVTARDDTDAVYAVRSLALYLGDGTLFALYGQGQVIVEKSAQAVMLLAVDVRFAEIDATTLTFGDTDFINPPATESREGVSRFATDAEAKAGTSLIAMLSPKRAKDALLSWLGFTPANRAGDTFTGAIVAPHVEVSAGDLYISRRDLPWGYILRPNQAGYRNLAVSTVGGATPLDNFAIQAVTVSINGNTVWHAGNDGAGSALDADLLDGLHADAFLRRDSNQWALSGDGRQRFFFHPDGTTFHRVAGSVRFQNPGGGDVVQITEAGQLTCSADIIGRGIYTITGTTTGVLFFGSNGQRYLNHDGINWVLKGNGELLLVKLDGSVSTAWTSGNDGAGSGLDADLLDGQQGSWYSAIADRLGYVPANLAGATFSGPVGFGDGQFAAYVSGGNSVLTLDTGDYLAYLRAGNQLEMVIGGVRRLAVNGGGIVSDGNLSVGGAISRGGYGVWDAGNDGAGSGLDADTLDGYQAAAFVRNEANRWVADGDGRHRFYFATSGQTYHRIATSVRFQNTAGNDVVSIDEGGTINAEGNLRGFNLVTATGASTGAVFFGSNNGHYLQYDGANWVMRGAGELYVDYGAGGLSRVWTPANDGSGSGLDADLLDGQQASYFTDIIARLGYTPANKAGQIFDGPIGPEVGFRMVFSDGNPGIIFTADNLNSVFYNRGTGYYTFYQGGRGIFDVDSNGNARFRGTVTENVSF